jgi:hypothetical protein
MNTQINYARIKKEKIIFVVVEIEVFRKKTNTQMNFGAKQKQNRNGIHTQAMYISPSIYTGNDIPPIS